MFCCYCSILSTLKFNYFFFVNAPCYISNGFPSELITLLNYWVMSILSHIKEVICNPGHTLEIHEKILRYSNTWPQPQWFYGLNSFHAEIFLEVQMCIQRLRSTLVIKNDSDPCRQQLFPESEQQAAALCWMTARLSGALRHRYPLPPKQGEMSFSSSSQLLSSSADLNNEEANPKAQRLQQETSLFWDLPPSTGRGGLRQPSG